jgi:Zn-dependent protease with chaperone function
VNFFEQQDRTRRNTKLLVFFFVLATLCIIVAVDWVIATAARSLTSEMGWIALPDRQWLQEHPKLLAVASLGTIALIAGASFAKTIALRAGGGSVAAGLGGVQVSRSDQDPVHIRLLNVVEEMAIASGVPVPEVYVMPGEQGINAFAAGFSVGDAAIGVTDGCARRLTRSELQGVIAHEFSHIQNGDMRLNMNLMGVLYGILLIGVTGSVILRGLGHTRVSGSGRGGGQGVLLIAVVGGLLWAIGYIGVFFGRLIKAAVSRQREFLADASAVQFTRDPGGIGGALKKIGGFVEGSALEARGAEEVSHMLFGAGQRSLLQWLATHPPLEQRIRRLDPSFSADDYERIRFEARAVEELAQVSSLAGEAEQLIDLTPDEVIHDVGNPSAEHLEYAAGLLGALPERLRAAAASPEEAPALMLAVLFEEDDSPEPPRDRVAPVLGTELSRRMGDLAPLTRGLDPRLRLPLLDLALPALKQGLGAEAEGFLEKVATLVQADERITPFEYALSKVLSVHLHDAVEPPAGVQWGSLVAIADRSIEVHRLLSALAQIGSADADEARAAFEVGVGRLPRARWAPYRPVEPWHQGLDEALARVDELAAVHKQRVVEALTAVVAGDGRVTIAEAELLRAVCEAIHCPIPPVAAKLGQTG